MSEENEKQDIEGASGQERESEQPFIHETIKKKRVKKGRILLRILSVVLLAILGGVIAAFVFVKMVPVAENTLGTPETTPRVTLYPDETETPTPTPTPTRTPTPTPTETPTPTPSEEPDKPTPTPTPVVETIIETITPSDLNVLYAEMLETAKDARNAIVSVIGITSQMDYFNQTYETEQQTSGLIIAMTDTDIYVLTNYAILENVERIQVALTSEYITDAIFIRSDPVTNMAVVRVGDDGLSDEVAENISVAPLGTSQSIKQGDVVIALGSPSGHAGTAVFGNVTATDVTFSGFDREYDLISTDIYGTSDGSGILVSLKGKVVGLIFSSDTESGSTVTALPVSSVKSLLERLTNNEPGAYVGIMGREVTSYVSERTGIPIGVLITGVEADSPAFLSGLTEGDVIVSVGDEKITDMKQLGSVIASLEIDETVTITAARQGAEGYSELEFSVRIGEI